MHVVTELGVHTTDHLNPMTILSPESSKLITMMFKLELACLPLPSIVDTCEVVEETHISMKRVLCNSYGLGVRDDVGGSIFILVCINNH